MDKAFSILRQFGSLAEADQACAFLQANGIESHVFNQNTARMLSYMMPALGDVQVWVKTTDLNVADNLLKSAAPEKEQNSRVEPVNDKAKRALYASVMGITFLPIIGTIYSIILSLQLLLVGEKTRARGSTRYLIASVLFNLIGIGLTLFIIQAIYRL